MGKQTEKASENGRIFNLGHPAQRVLRSSIRTYHQSKHQKRSILRMWALTLPFSALLKTFGCGRNQATRAKKEAKEAELTGVNFNPRSPQIICVSFILNNFFILIFFRSPTCNKID